ncbi:ABC transporter substrate-binding protein [Paenibacillus sp. NPDC056579]|uniref:ABC transporter substrate-binding protein n=1 Tax=Paenibacillus sp. NPDC056579 TaxID=3345871 RepID=UPI0036858C4C
MKHGKSVWIGFMVIMMLFFSACGGNTSNGDSGESGGDKLVTLKLWFPGHEDHIVQSVRTLIQDFEAKNPDIKVELTSIPWKDYFQKLSVAYNAGSAPDVHGLGFGQLISTVDQDKYLDLNPLIAKDNWDGAKDFYPDVLKSGQWKGGQYGLLMPDTRGFMWRKDLFKKAGLDPEKPPATIHEVFEYAEKLKVVKDGQTVQAGLDMPTGNGEQIYLSMLLPQGQNFYDANNNPSFDSSLSIGLLTKMVGLVKSGAVAPQDSQQLEGGTFKNGVAAMAFGSPKSFQSLIDKVGMDNIGFTIPPKGDSGKHTALMLGTFMTIAKNTKHPDAAWKFLKFMFEKENHLKFVSTAQFIPSLQSVSEQYAKNSHENKVTMDILKDAQGYLPSADWGTHVKFLRLALEEAYFGKKTPEEAVRSNIQLLKDEMKKK